MAKTHGASSSALVLVSIKECISADARRVPDKHPKLTATKLLPSLSPGESGRSIDAPGLTCLSIQREERNLPEAATSVHQSRSGTHCPLPLCVGLRSICETSPTMRLFSFSQPGKLDVLVCSCRVANSLQWPGLKLTFAAQKAMTTYHPQLGLSAPPHYLQARSRLSGHAQHWMLLLPLRRFQIPPMPERTWSFCCCVRSKARSHLITRPSIPLCHMSIGSILFAP